MKNQLVHQSHPEIIKRVEPRRRYARRGGGSGRGLILQFSRARVWSTRDAYSAPPGSTIIAQERRSCAGHRPYESRATGSE